MNGNSSRLRRRLCLRWLLWLLLFGDLHSSSRTASGLSDAGTDDHGLRLRGRLSLRVQLLYPQRGTVTTPETVLRCSVHRVYSSPFHASANLPESWCRLCVELDGEKPATHCSQLTHYDRLRVGESREMMSPVTMLSVGSHTAQCLVECGNGTADTQFIHKSRREQFWVERDAVASRESGVDPAQSKLTHQDPSIIVGVKTSIRRGMSLRQAIRATWASNSSRPRNIRVVFLGCRLPFDTRVDNEASWRTLMTAINLERKAYNDLLIDELGDCEDSYSGLVNKVTSFFRYVSTNYTNASTVMVTDDDVYVDLSRLQGLVRIYTLNTSNECFYAGQVWENQFQQPVKPIRDLRSIYAVSERDYPLAEFPPFAFGPHYLLSRGCLRVIDANQRLVPAFRGLDDITIAMWLLASGIRPLHIPQFINLRDSICFEETDIISLADTSVIGIYAIHSNLINGRTFCHDLDVSAWMR